MSNAGYSGTPLVKKLGIKPGFHIALLNVPDNYLDELPENVTVRRTLDHSPYDFIQLFVVWREDLTEQFPLYKTALNKDGLLWISWYKKAAKMDTDLTEDIIRQIGLQNGLVDVKVVAIDEQWSGLKFVYRKEDR
ncbi:MAG: DUF3052 domain-containing protein [Chloroflexi bacterium]|nr:DUF3052 domain-containing protein [Chloroflexota bacterium]